MKEIIIKLANEICVLNFMNYPDYDKDEPIDNLSDALTILILENTVEDIDSSELYDYIKNLINE